MLKTPTVVSAVLILTTLQPRLRAQSINGSAEWTVVRNVGRSNTQTNSNGAFWQNYNLGYGSKIVDDRLVKYDGELLFRTSSLTAASDRTSQQGHQSDIGYRVGASLFSASAFPFFVQMSHDQSGSSGELGPASGLRGGIALPVGTAPPDFNSENKRLSLGGQLNLAGFPSAEINVHKNSTVVTGGSYLAEQNDQDLSAGLKKDSTRIHHTLRYERSMFDQTLAGVFSQRLNTLDYDVAATLLAHARLVARVGRRDTFVHSETVGLGVEPGTQPYAPPSALGASGIKYATTGLSYEPTDRLALRVSGNLDQQQAAGDETTARLGMVSAHYEVVRGLSVNGNGLAGTRGQNIGGEPITVSTRSGDLGLGYQANVRWLSGTVNVTRGGGTNETPEGRRGTIDSWSGAASLSATIKGLGLGTGYDRSSSRDQILDFGNYDSRRIRAMAQFQHARFSLSASGDQVQIARGHADTFIANFQRTFSGTASAWLGKRLLASATAGGFSDDYDGALGPGRDQVWFWSARSQITVTANMSVVGSVRGETTDATKTLLHQNGLSGDGRFEWRIRAMKISLEYRDNKSFVQLGHALDPDMFHGHQFRFSLVRQFGVRR